MAATSKVVTTSVANGIMKAATVATSTSGSTVTSAITARSFIPRSEFVLPTNLPRSYYLGHHASGLTRMRTMLSQIDLVVECRDYRIPYTSHNPLLEESLRERQRMIVYTKHDLGSHPRAAHLVKQRDERLRQAQSAAVHFSTSTTTTRTKTGVTTTKPNVRPILEYLKECARSQFSLTGYRVLIAGMPNVGKSTLLNNLRAAGVQKGKAARTGAQPGITRAIASSVLIINGADVALSTSSSSSSSRTETESGGKGGPVPASSEGVYVVDTPGVFTPYVPDGHAMLKLALCGCVKDGLIAPVTVADYLLYHMNLHDPDVYAKYASPTNEVLELLEGVAKQTYKLAKGASPDLEAAATWLIQRWRKGMLGRFVLDDVVAGAAASDAHQERLSVSASQAKRMDRVARKEAMRERARRLS